MQANPAQVVPDLVNEVWTNILGRLNVLDRLRNCGLVSKRWSRLARHPQANTIIRPDCSMHICTMDNFQGWLEKYFEHVAVIDARGPYDCDLVWWTGPALPAPKLQQLRLKSGIAASFTVHMGPLLQQCAQLTLLSLGRCEFRDTAQDLEAWPVLAGLRHLDLAGTWSRVAPTPLEPFPQWDSVQAIAGCLLCEEPQLTHLRLSGEITGETLQRLGACTKLQELQLDFASRSVTPQHILDPVRLLAASLTKLSVRFAVPPYDSLTFTAGHAISSLTALQSPAVTGQQCLQPAVLQPLTALTTLFIINTPLAPRPSGCAAAAAQLLALLPRLQRLRQLSLRGSLGATAQPAAADESDDESDADSSEDGADGEQPAAAAGTRHRPAAAAVGPPAPEAFAALTFPTLEMLDLVDCSLPDRAWQHVFRAGLQMPQLRVLRLAGEGGPYCLTESLLRKLAAESPHLQDLALCAYNGVADLPLVLTKLHICSTSDSIGYRVAALTQLQSLSVMKCSFADRAMLALTALTRLTELRVESWSFSEGFQRVCRKDGLNHMYHRVAEDRSCKNLPIRARLLQDLMNSAVCQVELVQSFLRLEQQVQQQQQQQVKRQTR